MRGAGVRWRSATVPLALLVAGALGLIGCDASRPSVIVVVVDTLRADRVGATGGESGLTPFLDGLAGSGVAFRNARSTSSWTNPAVASLFTSRYPSQHRVGTFESRLSDAEVTLGERLEAAGWRGIGMVANFRLTRTLGFAQGFDVWFSRLTAREMSAQRLGQDAVRYWDRHVARFFWRRRRPLFLYLHAMEPHAPYEPGAAVAAPRGSSQALANAKVMRPGRWNELTRDEVGYLAASYDAEVAALDARLRRVFARLRSRGLLDGAIVVVTADHGEEFGEHGGFQHGRTLYQESVRVPLIMLGPGLPAGRVVERPVSLIDVAPTILDLLGLPPEPRFEGRSLLPMLRGEGESSGTLFELLPMGTAVEARQHVAGQATDELALLETRLPEGGRGSEWFDLRRDPTERRPNPTHLEGTATTLRTALEARRQAIASRAGVAETAPVDAGMRDRLRALGYAD